MMGIFSSSNSVGALGRPSSALPGISPSRGEIRCRARSLLRHGAIRLPTPPLVGEMPGRAEGGSPTTERRDR